jgi:hypothetical protein
MLYTYEVEAGTPEEAEELVMRAGGKIVREEFGSDFGIELDQDNETEEVHEGD